MAAHPLVWFAISQRSRAVAKGTAVVIIGGLMCSAAAGYAQQKPPAARADRSLSHVAQQNPHR